MLFWNVELLESPFYFSGHEPKTTFAFKEFKPLNFSLALDCLISEVGPF